MSCTIELIMQFKRDCTFDIWLILRGVSLPFKWNSSQFLYIDIGILHEQPESNKVASHPHFKRDVSFVQHRIIDHFSHFLAVMDEPKSNRIKIDKTNHILWSNAIRNSTSGYKSPLCSTTTTKTIRIHRKRMRFNKKERTIDENERERRKNRFLICSWSMPLH